MKQVIIKVHELFNSGSNEKNEWRITEKEIEDNRVKEK